MPKYAVNMSWMYSGTHIIEADNEDAAEEAVQGLGCPDGSIMKGSLEVDSVEKLKDQAKD